jgi:CRP/FNR family transcriptional regulator, anaerobic regulatory protein
MVTENFSKYIQQLFGIQDQQVSVCENLIKLKKVPKGRVLVRAGEINKELYFVEQGLLRQYFTDKNGKEHVLYFAPENWLLGDRNSSYFSGTRAVNVKPDSGKDTIYELIENKVSVLA